MYYVWLIESWLVATHITSILSVSVVCSHAWQVTIAICVYQWFLNVSFKSCVVVVSGKKAEEHAVIGKSQLLESRYTKKVSQSFFKGDRWAKDVKPCLGCKKVIGLQNILTLIFTGFSTQHNQAHEWDILLSQKEAMITILNGYYFHWLFELNAPPELHIARNTRIHPLYC